MKSTKDSATSSGRYVPAAFLVVIALFTALYFAAIMRAHESETATRQIANNMLESVALVSRMGRAIDHERLLLEAHIFENEIVPMRRVEQQIEQAHADYAAAAQAYRPLATQAGEDIARQQLDTEVDQLQGPIGRVLALSRQNRDEEALAAVHALDGRFQIINHELDSLVQINRAAAREQVEQTAIEERRTTRFIGALGLVGATFALIVGWWVTSLVCRREQELHRTSADLYARNRDLDAFAGRVAHDLRGPLTTISVATSRLGQMNAENGATAVLKKGVARMETLIDDLLALSRIDSQTRTGACDPERVAEQIREDLVPRLDDDGTVRISVAPAQVCCGEGLLRQVLWNLVDNAVKYRRPGVRMAIDIRGRVAGRGRYVLRVSDNGVGMSPDDARHAFDPFFRAVDVRSLPGTGLGLSIVKRVLEVNGGSISVDSSLGHGTTFTIDLPLDCIEQDARRSSSHRHRPRDGGSDQPSLHH